MPKRIEKSDEEWRRELTDEQFAVCRRRGTEPPFSGEHADSREPGIYRCVCCGLELFDSAAKYDSGTGWPSFTEPIRGEHVRTRADTSHGMVREEVLCAACDSHLGHVFDDGPAPTGRRYCMNSVALRRTDR